MNPSGQPTRHLVLTGLMGVGKTTVGRLAAAALHWPLCDSDVEILAREGETVRELQERSGAAALHRLEAAILLEQLASARPSVICAAAGTIEDARCRAALGADDVSVVWLRASLATLVARYDGDPHRPRYAEGTQAALAAQLARRAPQFASVAELTLDVDGLTPEETMALLEPTIERCSS